MAISSEDIARVRAATDIVALIGEHVALKRQGRRWVGLCPFHGEKSASFSVNAEEGLYYCFGCQVSGDAITFVREMEHLDFSDAVRALADKAGITITEEPGAAGDRKAKGAIYEAMEAAVTWYHERLMTAPDAGPARNYLRSRGYDGEVVRTFRLGWAPDEWDALAKSLRFDEAILNDAGLVFRNRRDRVQDFFRNRITFPICDPSGKPIAIGARILPLAPGAIPAEGARPEAKYKNSSETPIYSKRRTLYALNWAKQNVIAEGELIVCEGYTDVIGFFQAGLPRAVATCGTALAEEHFTLMRNFAKRITLAYDADAAGQNATSRVYEWEQRHEVDVFVCALPAGSDPADLARTDPEALRTAVAEAKPFLQFRLDRVFASADLSTPEGRSRAATTALGLIAAHPVALVQDQYLMQVGDRCRLDADLLRRQLATTAPTEPQAPRRSNADRDHEPERPVAPRRVDPALRPGLEALRLAVHRPEAVATRIDGFLFSDPIQRAAFDALVNSEDLNDAIESAEPDVASLLRRVTVEEPLTEVTDLGDPVDAVIAQLLRVATRRTLSDREAAARLGSEDLSQINREIAQVRGWLDGLDQPATRQSAEAALLAWLAMRAEAV